MSGITTSGEDTADKAAERKFNGRGILIFVGILIILLILFFIVIGNYSSLRNSGSEGQTNQAEGDRRAQP